MSEFILFLLTMVPFGAGCYFIGRAHGLKEAADLYEFERAMREG